MLLDGNVYSPGSVCANRENMPKFMFPADKGMEGGDAACLTSNDMNWVKWMENKGVLMLSNFLSIQPLQKVK